MFCGFLRASLLFVHLAWMIGGLKCQNLIDTTGQQQVANITARNLWPNPPDAEGSISCRIEFHLQLGPKPDSQHKEDTTSPHSPQAPVLTAGSSQWVDFICTCCCQADEIKRLAAKQVLEHFETDPATSRTESDNALGMLVFQITSSNQHVVQLKTATKLSITGYTPACQDPTRCVTIYTEAKCVPNEVDLQTNDSQLLTRSQGFHMNADNLGRSTISASLIWINISSPSQLEIASGQSEPIVLPSLSTPINSSTGKAVPGGPSRTGDFAQWHIASAMIFVSQSDRNNQSPTHAEESGQNRSGQWVDNIAVTVLLRPQKFYLASDWSAAFIAFMLALSVGCCNDPVMIRTHLRSPKAIMTGLFCQLIIMPLLSMGLGIWFQLDDDQSLGLFVVSTIPAGGLTYLLTYLAHGDRQLSAALSLISCLLDVVVSPMWAWIVGWFWFKRPINAWKTMGWLVLIASAQIWGTVMRGCRPGLARAVLTWITRPLLLLSGILLVTLGVYINHYAFNEVNQNLILALLALITSGFIIGWLAGLCSKQESPCSRALATASSVFNGLVCIPLIRTSLHAPEGDLSAVVALWATFLTPIPLAYHATVTILQKWWAEYKQKRRKKQEENSLAAMIGGKQSGLGATSVAAVTAAAVAVTPAITAGTRTNRNAGHHKYQNHDDLAETATNPTETNSDTSPSRQQSTATTVATKKTSPDTITPPVSPTDHPSVTFSVDPIGLEYEGHTEGINISPSYNPMIRHDFPEDHEGKHDATNEKRTGGFIAQRAAFKRSNWLKEPPDYEDRETRANTNPKLNENRAVSLREPMLHSDRPVRKEEAKSSSVTKAVIVKPKREYATPYTNL